MKILVVEDYQPLRESVVQGLVESGYAVESANNGEDGLWLGASNEFDVIVLDLMLPKLPGLLVLEKLRQESIASAILITTAKDRIADRVRGLDLGADDYLVKPFALDELLARVRALVRRRYENSSPLIRIAHLEINTSTQEAFVCGNPVALGSKEFAILEYLASNATKVISRTVLWNHLYDVNSEPGSNVLDVLVGRLRRKLEEHGHPRLIHTKRGAGYVLKELG